MPRHAVCSASGARVHGAEFNPVCHSPAGKCCFDRCRGRADRSPRNLPRLDGATRSAEERPRSPSPVAAPLWFGSAARCGCWPVTRHQIGKPLWPAHVANLQRARPESRNIGTTGSRAISKPPPSHTTPTTSRCTNYWGGNGGEGRQPCGDGEPRRMADQRRLGRWCACRRRGST